MKTDTLKTGSISRLALFLATAAAASGQGFAQGCVAAHSPQPIVAGLSPNDQHTGGNRLHGLTVTVGYRVYNSYRHYVGTVYQAQRAAAHNAVVNHVNLFDLDINYQLTPRWSLIADVPTMSSSRARQGDPLNNVYKSGGIGDVTVGAQAWVWRPPTETHGNVAFSALLKLPTGINDAKGAKKLANGTTVTRPFDESVQPGDGTWGFSLATQAYRQTYFQTIGYFTGSWLFSPQDTTGVQTFRGTPGEETISATDQYLWRGGFSHFVPKVRGAALSIGGRMEGVPVRDAIGSSNGFRRPGYVISIEPGLTYSRGRNMVNVSAPWAMERNRKISTSDIVNHDHGDAAFSDYTVIASYTRSF